MVKSYIGVKEVPMEAVMPAGAQSGMTAIAGVVVAITLIWGLKRSFREHDHRLLIFSSGLSCWRLLSPLPLMQHWLTR